jgi:hypothetical protein
MTRAFDTAGFDVRVVSEPQPLAGCRERFREAWERLTTRPQYIFFSLAAR